MWIILAVLAMLAGIGGLARWHYLKKQKEEQKGLIVIAGTVLAIWFFPSFGMFILGAILLMCLLGGCGM